MADDTKSGVLEGDETFVGVDPIYANAAVATDAPQYPEGDPDELDKYERFSEVPEPETVSNYASKKKAEPKSEAKEEESVQETKPSTPPPPPAAPQK
ncbi:hypothetical protein SEA_NIAGARA_18 [Gordonia phage Niagara]|nr:hypothetical protein SEA_NIAGARA_18 [Gordonia phage Niagara]